MGKDRLIQDMKVFLVTKGVNKNDVALVLLNMMAVDVPTMQLANLSRTMPHFVALCTRGHAVVVF